MDEIYLTYHGRKRIKERVGVGKSGRKIERAASIALEKGIDRAETKGSLNKYLTKTMIFHKCGNNMKIHASQIWVFQDEVLITVKPLPSRFQTRLSDFLTREGKRHGTS